MAAGKPNDDLLIPLDLARQVTETLTAHDEERKRNRDNAEKARGSFREFLKMAWPIMEPARELIHGWHIDCICDHLAAAYRGQIKRLLITVPPGSAKPVWQDEFVQEKTRGHIRLSEVRVGDSVLTHMGRYRRVTAVFEQGELDLVEVRTWKGRRVRCAPDHPFLTPRGWVQAKDLTDMDFVAAVHSLEPCGTETMSPEEARLLGYAIGDGCLKYGAKSITNEDPCVVQDVMHCARHIGLDAVIRKRGGRKTEAKVVSLIAKGGREENLHIKGYRGAVRRWVDKHGLEGKCSYDKFVPEAIFAGSDDIVRNFLGAYWSCDGYICKKDEKRADTVIGCDTVSYELACGIQHLLCRLGIQARLRTKRHTLRSKIQGEIYTSYTVVMSTMGDASKFAEQIPIVHGKKTRLDRFVRSAFDKVLNEDQVLEVVSVGKGICRCLSVEEDNSFTAGDLAVHNSKLTSVAWPAWIWTNNPGYRSIFGSYDAGLATRDSIYCRDLMMSPWYQETFEPAWKFSSVQNEKTFYTNTHKGFRIATSVGGKSLGTGWRGNLVCCFAAHTKILTEVGEIEIGKIVDESISVRVAAFNHETGNSEWRRIEEYECLPGRPAVRLTLSNGTSIECTEDHPIFIEKKGYISAATLSSGDALLNLESDVFVVSVEPIHTPERVFNIRVEHDHNYFANGVLVHNCDDPISTKDELRDVSLDSCINWWDRVMFNRFDDMSKGIKVIIMQRVTERDLAGHVLRAGGYEHVMIPNEYEPDRSKVTMIGSTEFWRDPRTERGELMCPALISREVTEVLKVDPGMYTGQYQQNPHPEGSGILKPHCWNYWRPRGLDKLPPVRVRMPDGHIEEREARELPDDFDIILMSWDLAFKDLKNSDYVAGGVIASRGSSRYLLDAVHDRMDITKTIQSLREMRARGWGAKADLTLIEDKANGPAVMQILGDEISGLIAVQPEGGKVSRARAISYEQSAGNWYLPHPNIASWVGNPADPSGGGGFIQECSAFPNGAHDDYVDMFSQGALRIKTETDGAVYKAREQSILVQPHEIPKTWKRVYGMCVTWNEIAAVWLAHDPQTGNFEMTGEYWAVPTDPALHVKEIRDRGAWIPGVISAMEDQRERRDGYLLAEKYVNLGLRLDATPEIHSATVIVDLNNALNQGKLKIFGNVSKFFDQYRMYRRDPKGKLPLHNVALMRALETAWQWGHERMRAETPTVVPVAPIELGRNMRDAGSGWMAG